MSQPTLTNGRWAATWSFNAEQTLASAVNPSRLSERIAQALNARRCLVEPSRNNAPNPSTSIAPIRLRSRSLVTVTAIFRVNHPSGSVSGAIVNQDAADAFKYATGTAGAGLGTQRIAQAMGTCSDIGEVFQWEPPLAVVCADYRQLREDEAVTFGVSSALGSTVAVAGTGPVAQSDNPAAIGRRLAPHDGTILVELGGLWGNLPMELRIGGGVALVILAAVGVGYARRSFA
jgi:hypothetical protein